jgi:hypothetical protein
MFDCARIVAETREEATVMVKARVKQEFPDGEVIKVFEARKSPWGAKNADGKMCPAEEVY